MTVGPGFHDVRFAYRGCCLASVSNPGPFAYHNFDFDLHWSWGCVPATSTSSTTWPSSLDLLVHVVIDV